MSGQHFPTRLVSLQMLRGIAACLVLILHAARAQEFRLADLGVDMSRYDALKRGYEFGGSGVDLFFVISGFVLVYITRDYQRSPAHQGKFLWSRLTRIYSLWWVYVSIMALYFLISYGMLAPDDRASSFGGSVIYYLKSLSLYPSEAVLMLGQGWTLTFEVYFYLIFTAILFLPRKFMAPALCVWAAIMLAISTRYIHVFYTQTAAQLIFSILALEFIAGALAAWCVTTRKAIAPKAILATSLALLAVIFTVRVAGHDLLGLNRVALYTLPFAGLVYSLAHLDISKKLPIPKPLAALGDWSYSLYLGHTIVILVIMRVSDKLATYMPSLFKIGNPGLLDNIVVFTLCIIGSLIAAGISYRFIERPLLRLSRVLFTKRRTQS